MVSSARIRDIEHARKICSRQSLHIELLCSLVSFGEPYPPEVRIAPKPLLVSRLQPQFQRKEFGD
jgi:hypothetical protein